MHKHHNTAAALALIALFGSSAAAGTSTGIIRFEGAIVEDACPVISVGNKMSLECPKEKPIIYQFTHVGELRAAYLPSPVHGLRTTWLDAEHRTGIVTVTYN